MVILEYCSAWHWKVFCAGNDANATLPVPGLRLKSKRKAPLAAGIPFQPVWSVIYLVTILSGVFKLPARPREVP